MWVVSHTHSPILIAAADIWVVYLNISDIVSFLFFVFYCFLSYSPLCERIVSDWVVLVFYVFELHCCLIVFVLRLIRDFNSNPFDVRKS